MTSLKFWKKTTYPKHPKALLKKKKFEKIFNHDHAMMPQKHTYLYGIYSTVAENGSTRILSLYQGTCFTLLPSRLTTQKAVYYKMYKIFSKSDFYIMFWIITFI